MKTRNSTTKKRTERLLGGGNTTEKVGSDILGRQEEIRIQLEKEKQKQEFLRKREAERKKKKELDDLQGKRLHTEMPNDQHKPRKLGREGFDQIKPVKVSAHRRHSPKRGAKTE